MGAGEPGADRAVVVGSGPNGLAAAVELARAGRPVHVVEAMDEIGGGTRTAELTRPGFLHDVCSSVHPMASMSPFFRSLPLADHGLEWVHPDLPLAHPFDDGTAAVLDRSIRTTVSTLDPGDRRAYRRLLEPLLEGWEALAPDLLAPLHVPRHPVLMSRFGLRALRSARGLAEGHFAGPRARALFSGIAAHSPDPLGRPATAAIGVVLALAGHAVGWPFARGGSRSIARALGAELDRHGGTIETGRRVRSLEEVGCGGAIEGERGEAGGTGRPVLLDLAPRQVLELAGDRLPSRYRRQLSRYRYGPGVCKVDWALEEPIPWRAPECGRAGTVHVGGTAGEIAAAARAPWEGHVSERPFVLLAQPSLFDGSRAPEGRHVAWAYCKVPNGDPGDYTERIEAQIERFAPGFRDVVLDRSTKTARDLEEENPNLVGGDVNGGAQDLRQLFFRPAPRLDPYTTPIDGLFLCSSSTPPGGGVHGMCGFHAARSALRRTG